MEQNQDPNQDKFFEQPSSGNDLVASKPTLRERLPHLGVKASEFFSSVVYFFKSLIKRFNARPIFLYVFLIILVLAIPLHFVLKNIFLAHYNNLYAARVITANTEFEPGDIAVDGQPTVLNRTDDTSVGVIHLRNKHKGIGASQVAYQWAAFAKDGSQIDSGEEVTYLLPEQDKFVVIPISRRVEAMTAGIDFDSLVASRPVFSQGVNLNVLNVLQQNSESGFTVEGEVQNVSLFDVKAVEIVVLLRGPLGNLRGAISTRLGPLNAGESADFHVLWPDSLPGDTVVDVRAHTNIYSTLNISLP